MACPFLLYIPFACFSLFANVFFANGLFKFRM